MAVEDCSQAYLAEWYGKKVCNFGAFGTFSFYPGKNLGAYDEAYRGDYSIKLQASPETCHTFGAAVSVE